MTDKIPAFEWNSEESGKKEFHLFDAALQSNLATRSCRFVLDPNSIAINTPTNPGPEPHSATDLREWRKLQQTYWIERKKFYGSFDTAIGILQSMLVYPSKARNDIDVALRQRPADVEETDWTPDRQFLAAMNKLRNSYAPSNETDTTTLRRKLQELSDKVEGGFHEYANQFTRLYTELIKSGVPDVVGATELREWVKAGIKNDQVINYLVTTICRPDVQAQPSFEEIFAFIRGYLTFLGPERDPYRVVTGPSGKLSVNLASTNDGRQKKTGNERQSTTRCTRCWLNGHRWNLCRSIKCNSCNGMMAPDAKFCPNWSNHTEPGTKWIHPSHRDSAVSTANQPGANTPASSNTKSTTTAEEQMAAAKQAFKQARKFLQATVRANKKHKG